MMIPGEAQHDGGEERQQRPRDQCPRVSPQTVLWIAGVAALAVFVAASACQVSGDMLLPRTDGSWQQWLHVSKYPPSLAYATLELGLLSLCLAFVAFAMLALLNPACRWYRSFKAAHSQSF